MFNAKNGFCEAYVRGCQSKQLRKQHYAELSRCETLEDVKTYLQTTSEYSEYLHDIQPPTRTADIIDCCRKRQVAEFNTCCQQASSPLCEFLEYLTYGHMIDNLVIALTGMLRGRSAEDILEKCNPIGMFESLPSVLASSNVHRELYKLVLVDTPLAKYFRNAVNVESLDELNIELVRNILYKEYLQDFLHFCRALDCTTYELMKKLLDFEADRHAIRITINSLGTELSRNDRRNLYTNFGTMYPDGFTLLSNCETIDDVRQTLAAYPMFCDLASKEDLHDRDLDKGLRSIELESCKRVVEEQFNLAVFYAFIKFQENELANLNWLTECIAQRQQGCLHEGLICVED